MVALISVLERVCLVFSIMLIVVTNTIFVLTLYFGICLVKEYFRVDNISIWNLFSGIGLLYLL